ncbi:hypothetical protein HYFRA_00002710 [Hymenoscyphus fraxineus]|uniref:Uncharacterized protein n=1 Tax=Hymenoscyphus fraxineus TaxID=746836 RepID=A0A9N9LCW7_9HELO|nr:hypothetical protein HYFRA_00002710 [Hymenoscyphus fraxineus]
MNGHEAHGQGQYQYHRDLRLQQNQQHVTIGLNPNSHQIPQYTQPIYVMAPNPSSAPVPQMPQFAPASYGVAYNSGPPWIPQYPQPSYGMGYNFGPPQMPQYPQPGYGLGSNVGPPWIPQYPQPSYGMGYNFGPPQMPQYPQPGYGLGSNVGPPWIPQYPQPSYGMGYNFGPPQMHQYPQPSYGMRYDVGPPQMPQYPQPGYGLGSNSSPAQFTQFTQFPQFPQMPQYPNPSYGMAPPLNNPPVHQEASNNGPVDQQPSNSDNGDQKPSNSGSDDQQPSNSDNMDQKPSDSGTIDQQPSGSDSHDQLPPDNRSDREDNGTKKRRQVILFHSCSSLCFVLDITPKQSMVNTYLEITTVLCRVAYHNVGAEIELAVTYINPECQKTNAERAGGKNTPIIPKGARVHINGAGQFQCSIFEQSRTPALALQRTSPYLHKPDPFAFFEDIVISAVGVLAELKCGTLQRRRTIELRAVRGKAWLGISFDIIWTDRRVAIQQSARLQNLCPI